MINRDAKEWWGSLSWEATESRVHLETESHTFEMTENLTKNIDEYILISNIEQLLIGMSTSQDESSSETVV